MPPWILRLKNDIGNLMKIAYMHYHLKTGGVTTVLKQQLRACDGLAEQLVIAGLPPDSPVGADTVHIPEIGYSSDHKGPVRPAEVARAIIKAIRIRFNGSCDVLHVHNPTLAKNRYFLDILKILQQSGLNLLLQIHDFAEDGRPHVFFEDSYPEDCHYCVINRRDYQILRNAGLTADGLHLLENTVTEPALSPGPETDDAMVLYPIRAIRRKNIGEAILLSIFLDLDHQVIVTLPPNSQADIASYRGWKKFAGDLELNVAFDRGLNRNFERLVLSAESLISTSINEGFGFSFLEPWLFGKLLWGRRLEDVCRDFESNGVCLQHLYHSLNVPVDWINFRRFRDRWFNCALNAGKRFNFNLTDSCLRDAFDRITADGVIDFGLLDESAQKTVINQLKSGNKNSHRLRQINPFLEKPGAVKDKSRLIAENRQAVLDVYNPERYRQKLLSIYRKIITTAVNQQIDKSVLVSSFLSPNNFSLLKWGSYSETS